MQHGDKHVDQARSRLLGEGVRRIEVSSNCSLSPAGAGLFFVFVATGSLAIAGGLAARGFWPVLPFAGAELFVLGLALGLSMRQGSYRERISVTATEVIVESSGRRGAEERRFPRAWTRIEMRAGPHRWYPARLLVGAHGSMLEIGRMLTEKEKRGLGDRLAQLVEPEYRSQVR